MHLDAAIFNWNEPKSFDLSAYYLSYQKTLTYIIELSGWCSNSTSFMPFEQNYLFFRDILKILVLQDLVIRYK